MALGGYIAPTIDWTQDSQLPDRLEDFKRECLTLFGLELKDADDNAKALRVIQWAGEPGKRQFKAWNIKAQDLKISKVWEEFEKFCRTEQKNFMRARFDLMKMQQRKDKPAGRVVPVSTSPADTVWIQFGNGSNSTQRQFCAQINRPGNGGKNKQQKLKKQGDAYTANKALERACEIQQKQNRETHSFSKL